MTDTISISISKNAIKIAATVMIILALGVGIVFAAYSLGKDIGTSQGTATQAAIDAANTAAQAVVVTVTPAPAIPVQTSDTFTVYQKFEDVNGIQWIQTTDNEFYRVAFVDDYRRAEEGYRYYAEFTGQITQGNPTVGRLSYISGAPVRVYSMQDNEWHKYYDYWPTGAHDMSPREYQARVEATLYNNGW